MSDSQAYALKLDAGTVQCHLHWEQRHNVRFSMTRRGPVLRAPASLSALRRREVMHQFEEWVRKTLQRQEELRDRYTGKLRWQHGDAIEVRGQTFLLHLAIAQRKRPSARLLPDGRTIRVELCADAHPVERRETCTRLLSRLLARHFHAEVQQRLITLNTRHFDLPPPTLLLRYARTRWGSCSAHNRITLNTRLLLAPPQALDYVIIHELAHRIHPNHSKAFWATVARAMPHYRSWHQWLHRHGNRLDF